MARDAGVRPGYSASRADAIAEFHSRAPHTYWWRRIRAEVAEPYGRVVNKKLAMAVKAELGISGLP